MNAAVNAALIAAAATRQQASEALLKRLADAKAFGPSSAVPLTPANGEEEQALAELVGTATVRPWNGGYYLDRERKKEREEQQGWIALVVLVAVISLGASAIALLAL